MALEVEDHPREPDQHREPSDKITEILPDGRPAIAHRQCKNQQHRSRGRKYERDVLSSIAELVDRVRQEDVEGQKADIRDGEHFHPDLRPPPPADRKSTRLNSSHPSI